MSQTFIQRCLDKYNLFSFVFSMHCRVFRALKSEFSKLSKNLRSFRQFICLSMPIGAQSLSNSTALVFSLQAYSRNPLGVQDLSRTPLGPLSRERVSMTAKIDDNSKFNANISNIISFKLKQVINLIVFCLNQYSTSKKDATIALSRI